MAHDRGSHLTIPVPAYNDPVYILIIETNFKIKHYRRDGPPGGAV